MARYLIIPLFFFNIFGLLALDPDITLASSYRIDLWIGSRGDNVYGNPGTGLGGSYDEGIQGGTTGTFDLSVQNEGDVPNYYILSWGVSAGWSTAMQGQDGSTLSTCDNSSGASTLTCKVIVPPSDKSCPYFKDNNANGQFDPNIDQCEAIPGEVIPLRLAVTPPPSFTSGNQSIYIDGQSGQDLFFDDFSDGTLAPWSQLQSGVVDVVNDPTDGWVLQKSTYGDPNGGWAPLNQTVGDFQMTLYTEMSQTGLVSSRYSLTDGSGNGYGISLNFNNGQLYLERRDGWVSTNLGTPALVAGGVSRGQWYTLWLALSAGGLTAEAYPGRVDPGSVAPAATVTASDATYSSFSQVNVNGGVNYYTDNVEVRPVAGDSVQARIWANTLNITVSSVTSNSATITWAAPSWPANSYDLRYSTLEIIEDGLAAGTGQVNFSNATPVSGLSLPKSAGSPESFTISQLYANTPYYFALKTRYNAAYTSVISLCANCPATTAVSTDTVPPSAVLDLTVTGSTADSVTLCWTAPGDKAFFDNFNDGTLAPWSQLQSGVVDVVNDPTDGWVLQKGTYGDPNGGWAPLNQTVGDFQMTLYTEMSPSGAVSSRYSLTDGSGNGYGISLNFNNGQLYLERRDGWVSTNLGTPALVAGGVSRGQWYTLQLKKVGGTLTASVYAGKGGSCTAAPAATVTAVDSSPYTAFTQINVNGGVGYYTDDIQVSIPPSAPPTQYLLRYSTRYIEEDGITPGMGKTTFEAATDTEGVGTPRPYGSIETYRVDVKNILAGNDGILNTPDDIDRTPDTQFFFALKSQDERGGQGQSPLSNIARGMTAMSSNVYNLVSVPMVPNPNTPADVFGDDVGSPLYLYWWDSRGVGYNQGCYDGLPDQYNPSNEVPSCTQLSVINDEIVSGEKRSGIGKGYLLWSPKSNLVLDAPAGSTETPAATCQDENNQNFTCYVFPLQAGWNMIGDPFGKEVSVAAMKVRQSIQQGQSTTTDTATFLQAVISRGWMGNAIYSYNGTNYTYESCDATGCTPVLQPWKGYWIWLAAQDGGGTTTTYDLLIPKP